MEAILFTYSCKGMNKTEASKISKKLLGYKDSSNNGKYQYEREGIIKSNKGIIISKSTFIIPKSESDILDKLKDKGVKIQSWDIKLPKKYLNN